MRKLFKHLLGEDIVNEHTDKEITEIGIGMIYCILMAAICWVMISVLA